MDFTDNENTNKEVMAIFQAESEEILERIFNNLFSLEDTPANKELIGSIYRDLHSLKGAVRMVGFNNIQTIFHKMEDIFDAVNNDRYVLEPEVIRMMSRSLETASKYLQESVKNEREIIDDDFNKVISDLEYLTDIELKEAAEKQDIAKLDLWYFAMVYLYRQSLELLLKATIFQAVTNDTDRKDIIGKIRHDLKQAFEKLIEVKSLTIDYNENAKWLKEYLFDISRIDRESDMFRYPFGSNFKALFKQQVNVSLEATHNNMNKAFNIIKDIYDTGALSELIYEAHEPQLIIEGGNYYQQSVVGY